MVDFEEIEETMEEEKVAEGEATGPTAADASNEDEDIRKQLAKAQTEANDRFFLNLGYEKDSKELVDIGTELFHVLAEAIDSLDTEESEERQSTKRELGEKMAKLMKEFKPVKKRIVDRINKAENLDDLALENFQDGVGGMMDMFSKMSSTMTDVSQRMNSAEGGEGGEGGEAEGCIIC